jgi:hypothetical protein
MSVITPKVDYGFLKDSVGDKLTFGSGVISGITDNPLTFVSPDETIVVITGLNDNLRTTENAISTGGHAAVTARNNAEKLWNKGFKSEGGYVNRIAAGDEHTINLGGYKSTTVDSSPWVRPSMLTNLKAVTYDVLGGIHFESDFQLHVEGYVYLVGTGSFNIVNDQLIMDPGAVLYALKADTHRKTDMTGLPRRKDMFAWAYGYNNVGAGVISLPLPIYLP